jgi:hypothetical protein
VLHVGGFAQRALIVTGPDAVIRFSFEAASPGELPSEELLRDGIEEARAAYSSA